MMDLVRWSKVNVQKLMKLQEYAHNVTKVIQR